VNAYYRVEPSAAGRPVLLGMRWDLCRGQIGGIDIKCVCSQAALTKLMTRYGLARPDRSNDRVRDDQDGQQRLCVPTQELCNQIIHCTDPDGDADIDPDASVTSRLQSDVTHPEPLKGVPPTESITQYAAQCCF